MPRSEDSGWLGGRGPLVLVLVVLALTTAVRLRLAAVPLERDEGEYAYAGQLILQGIPPYELAYNMKFPGTYYAYAAILALLGETSSGIRAGLALMSGATTLLLYAIGRRLLGGLPAAVGAASFALLALDRWVMGVFAHATHFVLLPALAGFVVLLRAIESGRRLSLLTGGALLGTAVLMKQHGVFFVPLGAALVAWQAGRKRPRDLRSMAAAVSWLTAGSIVPVAVLVLVLSGEGVLGRFWFWTFGYAREYVSQLPLSQMPARLVAGWQRVSSATLGFWLAGGVGLAALWIGRWEALARVFISGLAAAGLVAICPGAYFREHYFILLLPALSLLVGVAVESTGRLLGAAVAPRSAGPAAMILFLVLAASYVFQERSYLFSASPRELSRGRYGANPFIEAVEIARFIRETTDEHDRIAVLGSEPEVYFYAHRKSATGYIYAYPLMELQRYASTMQEEMMREIEAAAPRYLVFVQINSSWLGRPGSDRTILAWAERYVRECYELVGIADIHSEHTTSYAWEEQARSYVPRSPDLVFTFRRKGDCAETMTR